MQLYSEKHDGSAMRDPACENGMPYYNTGYPLEYVVLMPFWRAGIVFRLRFQIAKMVSALFHPFAVQSPHLYITQRALAAVRIHPL